MRRVSQSRNFAVMRNTPTHDLLTVAQAAEVLGMPSRTLHQWIATGKVAATKLGDGRTNAYVIARSEIARVKADTGRAAS